MLCGIHNIVGTPWRYRKISCANREGLRFGNGGWQAHDPSHRQIQEEKILVSSSEASLGEFWYLRRVKGIQGLRVVDASVMPIVPSGNTNIPTIMVAEKASDIIKESMPCVSHKFPNNYDVPGFTDIYNSYEYYTYDR
ncbi:hypothetical protein AVEN_180787-1 [Araneus ventricosus]|uniref:Glucose-methanol-choline oxidoreductase C-terminal domain-containing protein n=1 Tax=Araneus ventricosus TaxID=182803 RepID=A0A4Y2SEF6_ARAVE|nr:hypothetical protein AVEN_180787-1 [Araneus ventricosus]